MSGDVGQRKLQEATDKNVKSLLALVAELLSENRQLKAKLARVLKMTLESSNTEGASMAYVMRLRKIIEEIPPMHDQIRRSDMIAEELENMMADPESTSVEPSMLSHNKTITLVGHPVTSDVESNVVDGRSAFALGMNEVDGKNEELEAEVHEKDVIINKLMASKEALEAELAQCQRRVEKLTFEERVSRIQVEEKGTLIKNLSQSVDAVAASSFDHATEFFEGQIDKMKTEILGYMTETFQAKQHARELEEYHHAKSAVLKDTIRESSANLVQMTERISEQAVEMCELEKKYEDLQKSYAETKAQLRAVKAALNKADGDKNCEKISATPTTSTPGARRALAPLCVPQEK